MADVTHTPNGHSRTFDAPASEAPHLAPKSVSMCAQCGAHYIERRDTPAMRCHNCSGAARGAAFLGLDPDENALAMPADEIMGRVRRFLSGASRIGALVSPFDAWPLSPNGSAA